MLWFQAPFLPEWLSLAADCSFIEQALRTGPHAPSRAETIFTDEDVERCGFEAWFFPALACGAIQCLMTKKTRVALSCVPKQCAKPPWHRRPLVCRGHCIGNGTTFALASFQNVAFRDPESLSPN